MFVTRQTHSTLTNRKTDAGEVSVEAIILVPILFVIALMAVQAGVVLHGVSVANHVASEGATAVARLGASVPQGSSAVHVAAGAVGARLARPTEFDVNSKDVSVRVWVAVPRAVPFFPDHVTRRVTVPRERFVPYDQR